MAWGELKSPVSDEQRAAEKLYGTEPDERKQMASHADSAKHDAAEARRIALELGDEVVAAHFAMAITALQDGLAALPEHTEVDYA